MANKMAGRLAIRNGVPSVPVTSTAPTAGTAEQHIKEGKNAINWTRLSCRKVRNNEVRLQLHVLAYNLGNFMRMLVLPKGEQQRPETRTTGHRPRDGRSWSKPVPRSSAMVAMSPSDRSRLPCREACSGKSWA